MTGEGMRSRAGSRSGYRFTETPKPAPLQTPQGCCTPKFKIAQSLAQPPKLVCALRSAVRRCIIPVMPHEFCTSHLEDSVSLFRYYKKLAERAMAQVPDEALFATLDPESNSIAIIVKHLAGNMRSRWTDFLNTDGEKADRNRDSEFESPPSTRAELMAVWEGGWNCVFAALDPLTDADLARRVTIRTEPHSVLQAINRQLAHYPYHIGQIVYLARHWASGHWTSLTIPRGQSAGFNASVATGKASQR
jgi:hypothetical protein